jgi:chromosome segregation ATPase
METPPNNGQPKIRAFVPVQGNTLLAFAPAMAREHSGGQQLGKKVAAGRRHSPASARENLIHSDDLASDFDRASPGDSLEQLVDHLKSIQRETEDLEKQLAEEESAHQSHMETAIKERDRLKKEWKERDEASTELKKHVANLDRENRNAQNKRHAKEKLLRQKEDERDKRHQDISRWKTEIEEMRNERSRLQSEAVENEEKTAEKVQECRDQISELQAETKAIEEENRVKAAELKVLEEERKSLLSGADSEETKELDRLEMQKDKEWEIKFQSLQARGSALVAQFHQVGISLSTCGLN